MAPARDHGAARVPNEAAEAHVHVPVADAVDEGELRLARAEVAADGDLRARLQGVRAAQAGGVRTRARAEAAGADRDASPATAEGDRIAGAERLHAARVKRAVERAGRNGGERLADVGRAVGGSGD